MAAGISPDAILGAVVVVGLAGTGALWKLATMLAEVRGQVRHNGGSTLKDDARKAALAADKAALASARAEVIAEQARKQAEDLHGLVTRALDQHDLESRDVKTTSILVAARDEGIRKALGRLQADVTNVRVGQDYLVHRVDVIDTRTQPAVPGA